MDDGAPFPLLFQPIRYFYAPLPEEHQREMMEFLVRVVKADIWMTMKTKYAVRRNLRNSAVTFAVGGPSAPDDVDPAVYDQFVRLRPCSGKSGADDSTAGIELDVRQYTLLPLHAAAYAGVRPVLDLFLTTYKMPVDTRTPDTRLTVLHCLALSGCAETKLLPVVTWLVEEKGADVTCLSVEGYTAARMAFGTGKDRMHDYLKTQEVQQAVPRAQEDEERKRIAAVALREQMQQSEEVMAALLEELELEEKAAAVNKKEGSKNKNGKESKGKKKK